MPRLMIFFSLTVVLLLGYGCRTDHSGKELTILAGSENETLEPLIQVFNQQHNTHIVMQYKGSVDIMQELGQADIPYDAIWPANSLWIALGDVHRKVKFDQSIMTSPVIFGIRESLAQELGLIGQDVHVRDLLELIRAQRLSFMMTSATQSNSGASAYLGFLYALLGNPDVLTLDLLHTPQLKTEMQQLFSGINRSSGSSGWLKDLFLQGHYDAMVNYEAVIIETNQELVKQGREPLYAVYPVDGIVLADSPLGYLDHGNPKKEALFKQFQDYLLSAEVQNRILQLGRRTGLGGVMSQGDPAVFNPTWGINTEKILSPITLPAANVIQTALNLYQTEFRKPSLTIFCLDYSGSMKGEGVTQLKQAMAMLLDQAQAKQYLLNASSADELVIIPFSSAPQAVWRLSGNQPDAYFSLLKQVQDLAPGGGTNIYAPALKGLHLIAQMPLDKYIPAIILLTDGKSDGQLADFADAWNNLKLDIPVFSIMFGEADSSQLDALAAVTHGRVFDGRTDLVKAFRTAKGYN